MALHVSLQNVPITLAVLISKEQAPSISGFGSESDTDLNRYIA